MRQLSLSAIWLGAAVGTGTGYLLASLCSPVLQRWFTACGVPVQSVYIAIVTSWQGAAVGLGAAVVGYAQAGFMAASRVNSKQLSHALLAGIVCMVIGAIQYLGVFPSPYPVWVQLAGFSITLPAAALGAWIQLRGRHAVAV